MPLTEQREPESKTFEMSRRVRMRSCLPKRKPATDPSTSCTESVLFAFVGNAQFGTALGTAALECPTAADCLHAGPESEFADPSGPAGLISSLHGNVLLDISRGPGAPDRVFTVVAVGV